MVFGRLTGAPQAFLPLSFHALKQKSMLVTPQPSVTHKQPRQPDWADEGGSKLEWGVRALSSAVTSDPSHGGIYKTLEPEWTPAVLKPAHKPTDGCFRKLSRAFVPMGRANPELGLLSRNQVSRI